MVITSLTGDDTITPYVVAQYASEQGYYVPGAGLPGQLMERRSEALRSNRGGTALDKSIMEGVLKEGRPIIAVCGPEILQQPDILL